MFGRVADSYTEGPEFEYELFHQNHFWYCNGLVQALQLAAQGRSNHALRRDWGGGIPFTWSTTGVITWSKSLAYHLINMFFGCVTWSTTWFLQVYHLINTFQKHFTWPTHIFCILFHLINKVIFNSITWPTKNCNNITWPTKKGQDIIWSTKKCIDITWSTKKSTNITWSTKKHQWPHPCAFTMIEVSLYFKVVANL